MKLDFPVPARHALPSLKKYAHVELGGRRELAAYVEASRGCKHLCRHCPIPPVYGGRFFVVPVETVLADVRQQVAAGASHVTFGDPDFLNGPRHALAVARALHAEFPRVTFDFTAKVDHLLAQRAHLAELAGLGCVFVVSAAESLDDAVLAHLAKGHTRADIVAALGRRARRASRCGRPGWRSPRGRRWTATSAGSTSWPTRGWWTTSTPCSTASACWCRPARSCSTCRRCAPTSASWCPAASTIAGRIPTPGSIAWPTEVAASVAAAAERDEDPALTFDRVRALAAAAAGAPAPAPVGLPAGPGAPAPAHRAVVLLSGAHPGPVGPVLGWEADL